MLLVRLSRQGAAAEGSQAGVEKSVDNLVDRTPSVAERPAIQ